MMEVECVGLVLVVSDAVVLVLTMLGGAEFSALSSVAVALSQAITPALACD